MNCLQSPRNCSFETRRFPVAVSATPTSAIGRKTPEKAVDSADSKDQDDSALKQVAVEESPVAVKNVDHVSGQDSALSGSEDLLAVERYLVQVASFSSEKRANTLAADLQSTGMPVVMDVVDRAAGRLHRVRVGPFASRSEADAHVLSISAQDKDLSPRVLDLRPEDSSPVSTPSDPLVRWVVQVGSFGIADSADALVAKLRLAGLPAFSEKVTSADGSAYKVRIGPEIERDKALAMARKVKLDHDLDAFVTTRE